MPSPLSILHKTRAEIDLLDQTSSGNPNYMYLDQYGVYYEVDPFTHRVIRVPRSVGDLICATLSAGYVVVTNANTILQSSQVTGNELFYVKNARSNIQAQIDALGSTLITGPAGGDLTGTYPNPSLASIGLASGPYGSPTTIPVIYIDSKGRVISLSSVALSGGPPSGVAGGDLTGTYPNPSLVSFAAGSGGAFLKFTRDTKGRISDTTPVVALDITTVLGYTPVTPSRTLTINGTTFDLSANRTWTVGDVFTTSFYANPSWITSLAWSKISSTPTTIAGYGITDTTAQLLTGLAAGVNTPIITTDSILVAFENLQAQITAVSGSGVFTVNTVAPTLGNIQLTVSDTGIAGTLQWNLLALEIPEAATANTGLLSSTDWNTFNNKQNSLTIGNITDAGTDGITVTGGTGAIIGAGVSLSQHVSDATHNGYLSSTDWSSFNAKQPAGNYITALTGDATAAGPGSSALTLATVNANIGTFGSATKASVFTVNAKGLITAASEITITPAESSVTFTDITTNDASTLMHGYLKKLSGTATEFMNGAGNWATPTTSATDIAITDDTTTNATMYPVWVTANTGSLPLKVSSTKMAFNPSTGVLFCDMFGKVNNLTISVSTGTLTISNLKTLSITDTTAIGTNAITFAGTEVLTLTAAKNVTFADAFSTSGAFALTLTSTATSNATIPSGTNTLYSTKSGSISSSDLATSMSDESGTGALIFGTSPTFKTTVLINNPANTFAYTITPDAITANRVLNLPLTTQTETLAVKSTIVFNTSAAPATTSTTVEKMMGLANLFTPVVTGRVLVIINMDGRNGTAASGGDVQCRYGTGAAPANADAVSGTTIGGLCRGVSASTNANVAFSISVIVTGLTIGTQY